MSHFEGDCAQGAWLTLPRPHSPNLQGQHLSVHTDPQGRCLHLSTRVRRRQPRLVRRMVLFHCYHLNRPYCPETPAFSLAVRYSGFSVVWARLASYGPRHQSITGQAHSIRPADWSFSREISSRRLHPSRPSLHIWSHTIQTPGWG